MENINFDIEKSVANNRVSCDIKINGNVIEVTVDGKDEILTFPKESFKRLIQKLYMS